MQRQRQLLHERQAAAFEQLRAVALVKVQFVFVCLVCAHYVVICLQDLPRYPNGGKDTSDDGIRFGARSFSEHSSPLQMLLCAF
jgi:hypothetical protein